ncbi:MAG: 4Fe-4S dicluster domain-containing protein [Actinomycetia bacterium]|nr:4Fe-4S dicluster domain-containing protein [Actinomycetes bacterium]
MDEAPTARADLVDLVFAAGVVGAGGAGFPTHKKLEASPRLLIVNGAECEPLLASDRYLMRRHADEIVAGVLAVADACDIPRVVIGTKSHYEREIEALRAAIRAAGAPIEIHGGDSFYPAGDEQVLIYEITGETVPPGGIPLALGIVVINVTTARHIELARRGEPMTRRLVTVTGSVAHPCLVDAPVGALPADLIAAAGGTTCDPFAFVRGGPMMGRYLPGDQADVMGYGKADAGLVVLPAHHPLVMFNETPEAHYLNNTSACIQCQLCTDMCPRYLIGHQMRPHLVMRSVSTFTYPEDLADALLCCECGICELFACPMGLSPRKVNEYAKRVLRARGVNRGDPEVHPEYTAERACRGIPQARLIDRWQLGSYPTDLDDVVRLDPARVTIPTRHGVGVPADPVVAVGETVVAGQVIASVDRAVTGALVHASIDGRVASVDASHITIERQGEAA